MPEWLVIDPATQQALLLALTSVSTMIVAQVIKKLVAAIPDKWIPVIAPFFGALVSSLTQISSDTSVNVIVGALAGSAAVGVNQVKKQLAKDE